MKIITISREFGSGGRELGKRLADLLGYDYYDKEIITTIASNKGMDEDYVARLIEQQGWPNIPMTFHQSLVGVPMDTTHTELLLEQKRVIEQIAKAGNDCVIVGRNADVLLHEYEPFNIFVCADMEAKIQRCMNRVSENEDLNTKEMERKINKIDKSRSQTRDLVTDSSWGDRSDYHLTVNTSNWNINELALAVADFANSWFERTNR
ncbi:MAG: cytidylate kinase-like family protein [Dysgonamonadaceae bacterium]|nr:cytidylate kinase-like family protein [Dysgonamonadaceae bacterium]MDD4729548.1 cytidylate kinase-like family protein [Dysgonamonadaceae bacterium]